jgi:ubiquinone/menaquinone biosynthesis C-methylase UbiE
MSKETRSAEAFGSWAATYDDTVSRELESFAGITHHEVIGYLVDKACVRNGDWVLDVGTGTGWVAIGCAHEDPKGRVIGIDGTPEMLAKATRNAERSGVGHTVQFGLAAAESIPYPSDTFAAVLSSLALHHTDVDQALGEMLRVLRPGGRIVLADMGAPPAWRSFPVSWLMLLLRGVYRLVGGSRAKAEAETFDQTYTADEWRLTLESRGIKNVEVKTVVRRGQRIYPCVILACGDK